MKRKALKAAIPYTLPVMMGYLFLGMAFGILLTSKGIFYGWALFMSLFVYAGSMQFVAIELLLTPFAPLSAALVTLMVNARHLFYGLSMLEPFKIMGKLKPYMIFSLSDETYSLECSAKPPEGVERKYFLFFIALLDQSYWVIGTLAGVLAGNIFPLDSTGIDFAMTALFLVIFLEQWESTSNHIPALAGLVITFLCLITAGHDNFLLFPWPVFLYSLYFSENNAQKRGPYDKLTNTNHTFGYRSRYHPDPGAPLSVLSGGEKDSGNY